MGIQPQYSDFTPGEWFRSVYAARIALAAILAARPVVILLFVTVLITAGIWITDSVRGSDGWQIYLVLELIALVAFYGVSAGYAFRSLRVAGLYPSGILLHTVVEADRLLVDRGGGPESIPIASITRIDRRFGLVTIRYDSGQLTVARESFPRLLVASVAVDR